MLNTTYIDSLAHFMLGDSAGSCSFARGVSVGCCFLKSPFPDVHSITFLVYSHVCLLKAENAAVPRLSPLPLVLVVLVSDWTIRLRKKGSVSSFTVHEISSVS